MMTLDALKAERQTLADKLVAASGRSTREYAEACLEVAKHFFASLRLVMNPIPSPIAFLAIFVMQTYAKSVAETTPDAQDMANVYAETVDVSTITLQAPRIKRKEE